jgi:hypothetical protein
MTNARSDIANETLPPVMAAMEATLWISFDKKLEKD